MLCLTPIVFVKFLVQYILTLQVTAEAVFINGVQIKDVDR